MPAKRNFKRPAAATAAGFTEAERETFKECMGQGMKRKAVIGAMSITKAKHSLLSKAYVAEIETKICESGSAGKGPVAIAKEMQMPQQTVSNILKKHGIKPAEQRKRAFAKECDAGALLKDVTVRLLVSAVQPTSAKRPLRIAPTTEDAKRLRPLRDELATQPPRKKLKELAADEPDALDLASPG